MSKRNPEKRYHNYHKHTHYSNIKSLDCVSKPIDYIKRAKELGHTTYFTTEHGYQGNIFEAHYLCEPHGKVGEANYDPGLKCIYGVEAYYVDDISDKSERTMYHIVIISLTQRAQKEINVIMSKANSEGFYYKPRIDLKMLLSLTPGESIITTACVASRMFKIGNPYRHKIVIGYEKNQKTIRNELNEKIVIEVDDTDKPIYKYEEDLGNGYIDDFLLPVMNHFGENFYLEVQANTDKKQAEYNRKILAVKNDYHIKLIHANDSHYIKPEDSKYRDMFLNAKDIHYEDEGGFILDYPTYDEIVERYRKQGVLSDEEIYEAIDNTLIFDTAEGIQLNKEFKIPKVTEGDSNELLKKILAEMWKEESKKIKPERHDEYKKGIIYEYNIVKNCGMADYFILDYLIVKKAVEEYGAVLTRSGRGSAVSFYMNKLLKLTEVDRFKSPITLFPTRFMSAERILESKSLPDIDLNFADVTPVIRASKDILGEDNIYYMIAYKPLQESSALRLWCKALGMDISEYDEVAKDIDTYIDSIKWGQIIEDSKVFRGVIESVAPSPCSFLLSNDSITEEIGLLRVGDKGKIVTCCALDGYYCDVYKYLKNDYLTVKVYGIIDAVYKLIGRPIDDIATLVNNCNDKVWDIYGNALTTTINQGDSDFGKQTLKQYKPRSLAEVSAWVAAIRPGFASLLNHFLERSPYSTGVDELDSILEDSFHYLMYQESIMRFLVWCGMEEKGTYDVIKKIAKKKFKEEELIALKEELIQGWEHNVGTVDGFEETWQVVEDASRYSFNASHSLSVAIDSLYGAYLKSHYPLEYFSVALTMYFEDLPRTSNLIEELKYFNIELENVKFGKSGSAYTMDKAENKLFKSIASIKYCNEEIAAELFELSKNKYERFIDLIVDIKRETTVNSKQLNILTGLNFFSDFGENQYLLDIIKIYDKFYTCKQIKKDKMEELGVSDFLMKKYAQQETEKMYKGINNIGLINDLASKLDNKPMSIVDQVKFEIEYLEYTTYVNPKVNSQYYIVTEYKTYKEVRKPYFTLHNIKTGNDIKTKIKSVKVFENSPFSQFSILRIKDFTESFKKKCVNGEWVQSEETELIVTEFEVIK